ncbi:CRISPR-associated endonuclease Cas1 [Methanococcoides orientis]|uniref:CRISPR-associated endonuclease Cas1 n=1 Tax=Methanococcoides orientis TaxID=2822137 RepID=UPI001E61C0D6|nr:CRISPR-associated endonuclease Cas1 [Methanococcoides orientis]
MDTDSIFVPPEQAQEIVDLTVMNLIEKGVVDNKDFVRTESFSLRLRPTGARKVTEEFNSVMNHKTRSNTGKRTVLGICPVVEGKGVKPSACWKEEND